MKRALALALILAQPVAAQEMLPGGAHWAADVPANWNGTLLLYSRGYSNRTGAPDTAPPEVKSALLAAGYALVASDYGATGWAIEQAIPAQTGAVAAFIAKHGRPKRVIAWGNSMGGLITAALSESRRPVIDGGIAFCASIGGTVGMMNMALDGATAFKVLVAPEVQVTGIADDRANGGKVAAALADALRTPQGRARVVLSGVLAGIPGWTSRDRAEPAAADVEAQVDEIGRAFVMGVFLPRAEQEQRAGVGYSWTTGVDYRRQLTLSGRRAFVATLYRKAGLDLDADLARLDAAPRTAARSSAVAYMTRNYVPSARPSVPLLAVQAKGDGATSPSMQRAYAEAASPARFASLWLDQAGHCSFSAPQVLASIHYVEARLDGGHWPPRPAGFVAYTPPPMLRPCFRGRSCR